MTQRSSRPTVCCAVITLNEEQNLPGWLAGADWADEIVIVDGGSHDRTMQIARASRARVFSRSFRNFAEQRNDALARANSDWVFFVDADERPTPALVDEIRARLTDCRQTAMRAPIRSSIFGRPFRFSGTQDDSPLRLVRRGCGVWHGAVHEVLRTSGAIGRLTHHLRHETIPDLRTFLAKMHRYTDLEARSRFAAESKPCWRDRWIAPAREIFRRLIWKHGWLDGPRGWAFCVLSGLSEWVLAGKHRRLCATAHWTVELTRLQELSMDDFPASNTSGARRMRTLEGCVPMAAGECEALSPPHVALELMNQRRADEVILANGGAR